MRPFRFNELPGGSVGGGRSYMCVPEPEAAPKPVAAPKPIAPKPAAAPKPNRESNATSRDQEAAFLRALETWVDKFSVHIDNKVDSLQVLK